MFSPKELEGEVDHSFFDSDSETGKTGHQEPEKWEDRKRVHPETPHIGTIEEDGRVEIEIKEREKEEAVLKVETLEDVFSGLGIQSVDTEKSGGRSDSTNKKKESEVSVVKEVKSGTEDSDTSSRKSSPRPCSDRTSRHNSQSDDSSSLYSYSSVEPQSDSSTEERGDNAVFKNDKETERDNSQKEKRLEPVKHYPDTSKKFRGKFRSRSHSSSSEREGSVRGDGKSPAPSHKPSVAQVSSSPCQRPRLGSASLRQRPKVSETAESEDTVTDVTPLSTPNVSPGQSFDMTPPTEPLESVAGIKMQDVVNEPSVTEVDAVKRRSSNIDREQQSAVLSSGRRVDSVLVISSPSSASSRSLGSQRQRNYSFTNDEVRRIERENQRLLRELSRTSPRSRNIGFTHYGASPTARLYHSALNRQREQQRIQRENLAFLKRLESVKPTPGMTRTEQLADYQRQAGYLGTPAPLIRPSSGRDSRPRSTNNAHRTRPETARPSRTTAPRPAWS